MTLSIRYLRQPLNRQSVNGRHGVAHIAPLNAADRIVADTKHLPDDCLPGRDCFADRAEFCGGHGSGVFCDLFCGHAIGAGVIFTDINRPMLVCRCLDGFLCAVGFVGAPEGAICEDVELGHLSLSSVGVALLMTKIYAAFCGIARGKTAVCGNIFEGNP